MNSKDLFNRFLDNGGTREEFIKGRRNALMQAKKRSEQYEKAARAERKERIFELMQKGYTRIEAEEVLRMEAFEALESAHLIPLHSKVKRERIPRIGLAERAQKK